MTSFFLGSSNFDHSRPPQVGVLLLNLGTPDAPTPKALRRYLKEFLWDKRVIEFPRIPWWFILHLAILPRRPKKSAKLYEMIWTKEGSPLLVYTKKQAAALSKRLHEKIATPTSVAFGMRYGNPSVASALEELREQGATKILVLPLYPQYSSTTSGSTFDAIADTLKKWRWVPQLRSVMWFHDDPNYISALAESVREHWQSTSRAERLLFSFHGIPKRYFLAGDPYHCQCLKTARLVAESLELDKQDYFVSFQSRFGREEWIKPYTDETLKDWAREGISSVDVLCPAFLSDCLETLEEMDKTNREIFLEEGGKDFRYIPALNDRPQCIDALFELVIKNLGDWLEFKH